MVLKTYWRRVHGWPRRWRWPLKGVLLVLVVGLVLYPKPWLVPVWLGRLRNMNAVLDPGCPALAELEARVVAEVGAGAPLEDVLAPVERAVCARIPYAYDWETWGVMDYLPTVAEVFAQGREDCDGRAVVAASLLRRLGFEASLASDLKHMWVVTPAGEIMSPGAGPKTIVGEAGGTRTTIALGTVANLSRGMAFGVAVFPLTRELLIAAAVCAAAIHPWSSLRRRIAGCLLLVAALGLLRGAGASASDVAVHPALTWAGLATAVGGWLVLVVRAGGRRSGAGRPQ